MKAIRVYCFEEVEEGHLTYETFLVCGRCELVEVEADDGDSTTDEICQDCLHAANENCGEESCEKCNA